MQQRYISRSNWRKVAATLIAIVGFLWLYETTTIDSVWPWAANPVDPTQPQPGSRLQFSATAYCKGQTTASGVGVRTGIAAADRSILPVGSVVTVTTDNSRYNGVYTVMDTGPAVRGRELDLYMWSCKEALAFGRKDIQVEVLRLGWNPSNSTPDLIERIFRRPTRRPVTVPENIPPATAPSADEATAPDVAPDAAGEADGTSDASPASPEQLAPEPPPPAAAAAPSGAP